MVGGLAHRGLLDGWTADQRKGRTRHSLQTAPSPCDFFADYCCLGKKTIRKGIPKGKKINPGDGAWMVAFQLFPQAETNIFSAGGGRGRRGVGTCLPRVRRSQALVTSRSGSWPANMSSPGAIISPPGDPLPPHIPFPHPNPALVLGGGRRGPIRVGRRETAGAGGTSPRSIPRARGLQ